MQCESRDSRVFNTELSSLFVCAPQEITISELMKKLDILGDNAVSVC